MPLRIGYAEPDLTSAPNVPEPLNSAHSFCGRNHDSLSEVGEASDWLPTET